MVIYLEEDYRALSRAQPLYVHPWACRGAGHETNRASSRNIGKISFLPSEVVKEENLSFIICAQEQLRNL